MKSKKKKKKMTRDVQQHRQRGCKKVMNFENEVLLQKLEYLNFCVQTSLKKFEIMLTKLKYIRKKCYRRCCQVKQQVHRVVE